MIDSLTGTVVSTNPGGLLLRTGPVTWQINASSKTIRDLSRNQGSEIIILIHMIIREDDIKMYGFAEQRERTIFQSLLSVSGVGAKQAVKILSAVPPGELAANIESADVDALSRLPGIGKKTAQKIILSLQGELVTETPSGPEKDALEELTESLCSMGFDKTAVRKALQKASDNENSSDKTIREREQEIFRTALMELSAMEAGG
ncbi:Holliday junction branch migration protein RuvA [Spirochaeta dissipatitropha]